MKKLKNNKIFKIIFRTIEVIFFAYVLVYLACVIFQKISNNSSIAGYRMFTVVSGSMDPVYKVGDVLITKEIKKEELKVGDDVTFNNLSENMIITHRVIRINEEEGIVTQGVANQIQDSPIEYSQILGKVVKKMVVATFLSNLIRSQFGFFFFIFTPMVIIIFLEIIDVFKKDEEEHE